MHTFIKWYSIWYFLLVLTGKGNHGPCALFSDGDYIGQIASAKDVSSSMLSILYTHEYSRLE